MKPSLEFHTSRELEMELLRRAMARTQEAAARAWQTYAALTEKQKRSCGIF